MKNLITTLLSLFILLNVSAKETVFKGYILNKDGQRIDGQIKKEKAIFNAVLQKHLKVKKEGS